MGDAIANRQNRSKSTGFVNASISVFTPQEAVADALQSLAIESLDPGQKARKLADSYARGRTSIEDLSISLDRLDAQERLER